MAVAECTQQDFKTTLSENDKVAVKFYADWCGACKLISPKYRRLSEDDRFGGITFAEINAEKNEAARQAAGVDNLPFFAVFKGGELVEGTATSKIDKVEELLGKLS